MAEAGVGAWKCGAAEGKYAVFVVSAVRSTTSWAASCSGGSGAGRWAVLAL